MRRSVCRRRYSLRVKGIGVKSRFVLSTVVVLFLTSGAPASAQSNDALVAERPVRERPAMERFVHYLVRQVTPQIPEIPETLKTPPPAQNKETQPALTDGENAPPPQFAIADNNAVGENRPPRSASQPALIAFQPEPPLQSLSQSPAQNSAQIAPRRTGETPEPRIQNLQLCLTRKNKTIYKIAGLDGKDIKGLTVRIRTLDTIDDISPDCRILFIERTEERRLDLAMLAEIGILTVGESEQFSKRGGAFSVMPLGRKVSFDINVTAARAAGVEPSAKLLQLASMVYDK